MPRRASDFPGGRKAPYAPISALREFLERMRSISVPSRVDVAFLKRLGVATNNEWSLISALKFLNIVDDRGIPTQAYTHLQTRDLFQPTLRSLAEASYAPLILEGGLSMSTEELRDYFRVASSPSQSKNAARFFQEVVDLAGMRTAGEPPPAAHHRLRAEAPPPELPDGRAHPGELLLQAKARLIERFPIPGPDWTAEDYRSVYQQFLQILQNLDQSR